MADTGNGWHTVLHIKAHNEDGLKIMNTQKRLQINKQNPYESLLRVAFNINDTRRHAIPRHLARIGTDPSCDIVLPVELAWFQCYFDVNSISGEILLHTSFDGSSKDRHRTADLRLKRWDVAQDEFKLDRVHIKTKDWAVVLHPDLSKGSVDERQYVLKIGRVEFLLCPPSYGPGTYSPSPDVLRYMKSNFGCWDRPQHSHAVYNNKITNVPIRQLGRGGQGFVNHVVSTLNGCHFARKEINVETIPNYRARRDGRSFFDILCSEVALLAKLHEAEKCKHIVRYLHTEGLDKQNAQLQRNVIVYMDVYECSLSDMITGGKFKNLNAAMPLLMRMVKHMATALSALSDINAIHRDVKPENILYDGSSFHITDFGLAKAMDGYATFAGTDAYRAPEVDDGRDPHTPKVDMFSLGVTIAACVASLSAEAMLDAYRAHKSHWPKHVESILSVFGASPLAFLACALPYDRPAAQELLDAVRDQDLGSALGAMAISPTTTAQVLGRAGASPQEHSFPGMQANESSGPVFMPMPNFATGPMGEPFPPLR